MPVDHFAGYVVRKQDDGSITAAVEPLSVDNLPAGDVLVDVAYSSLNYKDALACGGHPGVVQSFPHVPGIDCAGTVVSSTAGDFQPGDEVLVTGYDLGGAAWGGFCGCVRVPAEWVVPLPSGLTLRESMILGTAGFTAAQAVAAIIEHGVEPAAGPVVVTGATGGVGSLSVAILAKLGYTVDAVTGKQEEADFLRSLGACQVLDRRELADDSKRPLLSARWAAAVDTVGGKPLVNVLRSTRYRGCVAACGLVAGDHLEMTVYPFILRGVTLSGIDSAKCPRPRRLRIWDHLASDWHIDGLDRLATEIDLSLLAERVETILAGGVVGRTILRPVNPD